MKKAVVVFMLVMMVCSCFSLSSFAVEEDAPVSTTYAVRAPEYAYPLRQSNMYSDYMDHHSGGDPQNYVFTSDTLLVLSYVTDMYGTRWVRCQVIDTDHGTAGWRGYVLAGDLRIVQQ